MSEPVTNWTGQVIEVGSIVYRGARDGNSSSYKVGIVRKLEPSKPPRVEWVAEPGYWGDKIRELKTMGSPSADSLIVVQLDTMPELGFLRHRFV